MLSWLDFRCVLGQYCCLFDTPCCQNETGLRAGAECDCALQFSVVRMWGERRVHGPSTACVQRETLCERRTMTKSSEEMQRRCELLAEISQMMVSTVDPAELLRVIMTSAQGLFVAEACSLAVIDPEARELVFAYATGGADVKDVRIPLEQGVVGWVARTGESVVCKDVSKDPRFFGGVDARTGFRTRSLLCAPLSHGGRILGAIEIINPAQPELLAEEDTRLLRLFGGLAGAALDRARLFASTHHANIALEECLEARSVLVLGQSALMEAVVSLARKVAGANTTVLLLGESGTGKEVLARSIHRWSARAAGPFVPVNCVALSPELMESEMFGHEKGAFTGATALKTGKFELAEGGTIFLDEIGDLPLRLQTKLLRVLQEREFQRVGGNRNIRVDVRVLAATNRELQQAITAGAFREDLYYRLNVVSVTLPPLRERREDIPALVNHFIRRYSHEVKRPGLGIEPAALELLQSCPWPGNVRELQNAIERAVVLCGGSSITLGDLRPELRRPASPPQASQDLLSGRVEPGPMAELVERFKRSLIQKTLQQSGGNQSEAARLLGLQRANLSRLMKALGLR
jgi:Nif-specific regulatory protein